MSKFLESIIASLTAAVIFTILVFEYNKYKIIMNNLLKQISRILLVIIGFVLAVFIFILFEAIVESIFFPNLYNKSEEYILSNIDSDTTYISSSINTRRKFTSISIDPIRETYNWSLQLDFFYNTSIISGWRIPYCRIFRKLNVDTLYIKEFNPYYQINKELPLISNYYKQRILFNIEYKNGGTEFEISRNNHTIYKSSNFPGQEFIFLKAWGGGYDYSIKVDIDEYF